MHRKTNKKPKIRFGEFYLSWYQVELKEIVERVTRKNSELVSTLPLTISAQDGLINQNKYFNKQIASKDVSGYFLVENGEFAYNKSYSNGYPLGAIKRLDNYEMGVLSTLYIVFKPTNVNSQFLVSYYDTNYWHKEVSSYAAEGARNHGLLNISSTDFFRTLLIIPTEQKEQEKIGSFFKKLDEMIDLQQQCLDDYKQLKKVMLRKMFPKNNDKIPQIRFYKYSDTWELRKLSDIVIRVNKSSSDNDLPKVEFEDIFAGEGRLNKDVSTKFDNRKGIKFESEDILYGKLRPYLKNWLMADFMGVALGDFWVFRAKESIPSFIYALIQADKYQKVANDTAGTKMPRSDWKKISNTDFLIPKCIEEQQQVGTFFKQLDNTIALHQSKLDSYKELKKAMLQRMFI